MRIFSCVASLTGLALTVTVLAPASASATQEVMIQEVKAVGTGWHRQIEVRAKGGLGVDSIKTMLDQGNGSVTYATVDDFGLVSGTVADGIWRSDTPVALKLGTTRLITSAASTDGEQAQNTAYVTQHATSRFVDAAIAEEKIDSLVRKITYEGRVVYTGADGADVPASGRAWLVVCDSQQRAVTLDETGRFRGSVTLPFGGPAYLMFTGPFLSGHGSEQTQLSPPSRYNTHLSFGGFAPGPVGKGTRLTVTGMLSDSTHQSIMGAPVHLQFSVDGERSWRKIGQATTLRNGTVRVSAVASKDGHWRLSFPGDFSEGASLHHNSSVSQVAPVDVRYRMAVSSFNAGPEPVRRGRTLTVSGALKRSADGKAFRVWAGRAVYVYYQTAGSKTWTYAGSVQTDRSGKFRKGFKAGRDATWKAVYKGDADHLPADSATDYVDVR